MQFLTEFLHYCDFWPKEDKKIAAVGISQKLQKPNISGLL